jgi:hypothetical protein
MLFLLRILFGAGFAYAAFLAWDAGQGPGGSGDLEFAFYLAVAVVLAVANAVVWAPALGNFVSNPITGVMTHSTYVESTNYLLRLVTWLHDRKHRRLARYFSFLEGIHHPERPSAFLLGLANSEKGSWLEKVYARELFRFDNAENCLKAFQILKEHGIDPRPHSNPSVNAVLMSTEHPVKPEPREVPVPPPGPPPKLERNPRITLFETDAPNPPEPGTDPTT